MIDADPRDDFSIFQGHEHMFMGLEDPFRYIRDAIEIPLRNQVASTVVNAIDARGEPKWLTLGRRHDENPDKMTVTHVGCCFRCEIDVEAGDYEERLEATITLLFGEVDRPHDARARHHLDVHQEAATAFQDDVFKMRLMAFRNELLLDD